MINPSARPGSENMKSEKIKIFRHQQFSKTLHPKVAYGFFGRSGGESTGIFESLNCGLGSNDDPEIIARNRARVAEKMGIKSENLLSLYQVHGNTCLHIDRAWSADQRPQADAMVADKPGIGLGVLIADCAPVLFHARKPDGSPLIGAAHAGWKGALGGIVEATLESLRKQGADPQTLSACIGPCIGPGSYEVSAEFIAPFKNHAPESERFFQPAQKTGHLMFDLPSYVLWRLECAGIKARYDVGLDTFADEKSFYSYRRSTHRKQSDYGRQIAVIALKI